MVYSDIKCLKNYEKRSTEPTRSRKKTNSKCRKSYTSNTSQTMHPYHFNRFASKTIKQLMLSWDMVSIISKPCRCITKKKLTFSLFTVHPITRRGNPCTDQIKHYSQGQLWNYHLNGGWSVKIARNDSSCNKANCNY